MSTLEDSPNVAIPYKSGKYSYMEDLKMRKKSFSKMSQSLINQGNILNDKHNEYMYTHNIVAIPYKSGKYS